MDEPTGFDRIKWIAERHAKMMEAIKNEKLWEKTNL